MPHRKRILLSDDNEGFSTLLLESLHEHGGFHVLHAREEHEVMATIQCHKPHILLLDDMLPALARGEVRGTPQVDRFATWAARRTDRDGRIDWRAPAAEVARLIRAVIKFSWTASPSAVPRKRYT